MPLFDTLPRMSGALPSDHRREYIPSGTAGTAATIARMRDLVTEGKRDFRIRSLASQIIRDAGCGPKEYYCYAQALYQYCRDQILYIPDPNGVELIEQPWRIVESKAADCDSIVILLASMAESCGFPCRFVTVKADPSFPNEYSHVYLRIKIQGHGWVGADAIMPNEQFGWEPPEIYKRTEWNASNDPPAEGGGDGVHIPAVNGMGNMDTNIPSFLPGEGDPDTGGQSVQVGIPQSYQNLPNSAFEEPESYAGNQHWQMKQDDLKKYAILGGLALAAWYLWRKAR